MRTPRASELEQLAGFDVDKNSRRGDGDIGSGVTNAQDAVAIFRIGVSDTLHFAAQGGRSTSLGTQLRVGAGLVLRVTVLAVEGSHVLKNP